MFIKLHERDASSRPADVVVVTVCAAGTRDLAVAQVISLSRQLVVRPRLVIVANGGTREDVAFYRDISSKFAWVDVVDIGVEKPIPHGEALDRAFDEISFVEPRVIVCDSDCFLTDPSSLQIVCREIDERKATGSRSIAYGVETFHVHLLAAQTEAMLAAWKKAEGFRVRVTEPQPCYDKARIYWDTGVVVCLLLSAIDRPKTSAPYVHAWWGTRCRLADSSSAETRERKKRLDEILSKHDLRGSFW